MAANLLERTSNLIAKKKPCATSPPKPPVFMPTTSPLVLSRGPPLFPGLIEESCWMYSTPRSDPNADTTPWVVIIFVRKPSLGNGYPSATTSSPSRAEVANGSTVRVPAAEILSNAISRVASDAMMRAVSLVPLSNMTVRLDCPFMTCSLVRM